MPSFKSSFATTPTHSLSATPNPSIMKLPVTYHYNIILTLTQSVGKIHLYDPRSVKGIFLVLTILTRQCHMNSLHKCYVVERNLCVTQILIQHIKHVYQNDSWPISTICLFVVGCAYSQGLSMLNEPERHQHVFTWPCIADKNTGGLFRQDFRHFGRISWKRWVLSNEISISV